MNTIVIEHVKVSELPEDWRLRLQTSVNACVTVRIEEESEQVAAKDINDFVTSDPAFGIWRDRTDISDVEAYLHKLRAPRYTRD